MCVHIHVCVWFLHGVMPRALVRVCVCAYTYVCVSFQHMEFRKQWKADTILEELKAPEVGEGRRRRGRERER